MDQNGRQRTASADNSPASADDGGHHEAHVTWWDSDQRTQDARCVLHGHLCSVFS